METLPVTKALWITELWVADLVPVLPEAAG